MNLSFNFLKDYKHLFAISFVILTVSIVYIVYQFLNQPQPSDEENLAPGVAETGAISIRRQVSDDYIDIIVYYDEASSKVNSVHSVADTKVEDVTIAKKDDTYTLSIKSDSSVYIANSQKDIVVAVESAGTYKYKELKFKIKNPKKTSQTNLFATPVYAQEAQYKFLYKNPSNKSQSSVLDIVILTCGFDDGPSDVEGFSHEQTLENAKDSILTGSFFEDYKDSYNIIGFDRSFSDIELGCESIAGRITQVNESVVADIKSQVNGDATVVIHARKGGGAATIPGAANYPADDPNRFSDIGSVKVDAVYKIGSDGTKFRLIVHELGHSFCTLHDEYTGGFGAGLPFPDFEKQYYINCKGNVNDFPTQYRPTQEYVGCLYDDGLRTTKDSLMRHEAKGDGEVFNKISYAACVQAIKYIDKDVQEEKPAPEPEEPKPIDKPVPPKPPIELPGEVPKREGKCDPLKEFCFL